MKIREWLILAVLMALIINIAAWAYFWHSREIIRLKALRTKQQNSVNRLSRPEKKVKQLLPYRLAREVVFTFDDGPYRWWSPDESVECTEIILDALKVADIKATFFVLGCQFDPHYVGNGSTLARYKKWLRRMMANGHTIAIHDYAHISYLKQSQVELTHSLEATYQKIKEITGMAPVPYVRSPGGMISKEVQEYLTQRNYQHIYWHIEGEPLPQDNTGAQIEYLSHISTELNQGRRGIILMHDRNAYLYIKELISFLNEQDIPVITLEEWLHKYGLPHTPLRTHQGKFTPLESAK